jgi:hypothetical protein
MFDWLSHPANFFWLAIASMCIVPSVLYYLRGVKRDEREAELKRDMIARGMSPEDIERVLKAKSGGDDDE